MDDDFEILKSKVIICYFLLKIEKNKLYIYIFFSGNKYSLSIHNHLLKLSPFLFKEKLDF